MKRLDIILAITAFIFVTVIATCYAISTYQDVKLKNQGEKERMFYHWMECIDNSDGSDTGCEACDYIFNPNKDFTYP